MRHGYWIALCAMTGFARADELAMKDLTALDQQKQWAELLDRADQVKPSNRDASWNKLVISAGVHVVDTIKSTSSSNLSQAADLVATIPTAERKYPFLKDDAGYRSSKAKAIDGVVGMCKHADDSRGCGLLIAALANGVDKFSKGTAKTIALMVGEDVGAADAIHFWSLAVADDTANCKDAALERSVIATLTAGGEHATEAKQTAGTCFAALDSALNQALIDAEAGSTYAQNACPLLKQHGAMTIAKKKKCP
ncbi:MAG: hypothetical protein QM831_27620 [Kofleriaceae bacterium]